MQQTVPGAQSSVVPLFHLIWDVHVAGLKLGRNGRPLTMWNRDCTDYPDLNLYGSHPFVLEVREGAHNVNLA